MTVGFCLIYDLVQSKRYLGNNLSISPVFGLWVEIDIQSLVPSPNNIGLTSYRKICSLVLFFIDPNMQMILDV